MARADFRFLHRLRVRWAEVDRQGIVFNGHYLTYFDVAITEYWRAAGMPYPAGLSEHDSDLFVVKATVEYHGSAVYDDELDIGVRAVRVGRSSVTFALEVHRGDVHLVSGEIVYVNADPRARKSVPLPAVLREALARVDGATG